MTIKDLYIQRSLDVKGVNYIFLTWDSYIPGFPNVTGFNIYRSDRAKGYFKRVGENVQINSFKDPIGFSYNQNFFYKVVPILSSGEIDPKEIVPIDLYGNEPKGFNTRSRWIFREMIRRNNWVRKQIGEDIVFLLRKRVGPHCPDCYIEESNTSGNPNCPTCFGTGIQGGFVKMDEIKAGYEPADRRLAQEDRGLEVRETPRYFIADYPYLSEFDFLIRKDGSRWFLSRVLPIRIENYLVQQDFRVLEVPVGWPIYKVDIT